MPEPRRIRDARREVEEYGEFRAKAMRGPGRHASLIQPASGHCARYGAQPPLPTRPRGAIVSGHMISRRGFVRASTAPAPPVPKPRSEERRVGKECRV